MPSSSFAASDDSSGIEPPGCPKHNGRFDAVTGAPTRKPIRTPLCVYDVDEIAGRIVTHLTVRSNVDA